MWILTSLTDRRGALEYGNWRLMAYYSVLSLRVFFFVFFTFQELALLSSNQVNECSR